MLGALRGRCGGIDQGDSSMPVYCENKVPDAMDIRDSRDLCCVRGCEVYVLVLGKNIVHHRNKFYIYKFYVQCVSACG